MKSFTLLVAVPALILGGCIEKVPSKNIPDEAGRVVDMTVPDGFDWAATREVGCNIAPGPRTKVSVAESADAEPFAVFYAGGDAGPVTLNVPSSVQTLYVSYSTPTGTSAPKAVSVAANTLSFTPGNDRFDDTPAETDSAAGVVYIPARAAGWGTLMFEDLWPSYGDYDFNDCVFKYRVEHRLNTSNKVVSTRIAIRVAARSGSIPYEFYLQMSGLKGSDIDGAPRLISYTNTVKTPVLELLPPFDVVKDRPVFRFADIYANVNRPAGSAYVNAEKGYELADDQLVEAVFEIRYTNPVIVSNLEFVGLDFFIAVIEDGGALILREIHRYGYEPINMSAYDEFVSNSPVNDLRQNFYRSKDNLIWALNVPADIRHCYEKGNFLDAYPYFKTWAQSGGRDAADWYENGVDRFLVKKQ